MAEGLHLTTLETLANQFDVFLVDQFGVLLDGSRPYPGAAPALRYLKDHGKLVIILSNSGRAGLYNAQRLEKLGIAPDLYDTLLTSGDVAYELVRGGTTGIASTPGTRCLTISSGNDTNLAERLEFETVDTGDIADVVIISGSRADTISMESYAHLLTPAAQRHVPALCTNPDIHMLTGDGIAPGAGAIAQLYEKLGGVVRWIGKPHAEIYQHAMRIAGNPPKSSFVAIGDSIDHDIKGAYSAGIESCLVRTGIHAEMTAPQILSKLKKSGFSPKYIMSSFQVD